MKKCNVEGCEGRVFGKNVCKFHYSGKKTKPSFRSEGSILYKEKRNRFFNMIWRTRTHRSEVSGALLGNSPSSLYFHHILPKRTYKEAEFDEENIILLTPEEHASVELDIYKYEEVNNRREKLKQKYNII